MKDKKRLFSGILVLVTLFLFFFSSGCSDIIPVPETSSSTSKTSTPRSSVSQSLVPASPGTTIASVLGLEPITILNEILYQDDFSDPKSGWPTGSNENGSWNYESGVYSLQYMQSGVYFYTIAPSDGFSDFAIEVDATALSFGDAGDMGILFRQQDKDNYYRFILNNGNFKLLKRHNGEWTSIQDSKKSEDILPSPNTNKLKIVCLGSQIDLYANGRRLGSYTDSTFTSGKIGLEVCDDNSHIHFDNLKVYAVSASIPETARLSYAKAVESQESGDAAAAIEFYEEAIRSYAMYTDAWNGKGETLAGAGQYEEALKCFQNTTQIYLKNSHAWVNQGKCLEALGDQAGAISCFNKALKMDANNAEAKEAKEKLLASGTEDNTNDPPAKQYAPGNLLQVTGPALTITVNEGDPFTTTMSVRNGQTPYFWFLKTDNGITSRIYLSTNESGDTLTVSGIAALIADDTTESRYAVIEVWAEDSSTLTRKGEGSFQVHVINTATPPSPTPKPSVIASTPSGGQTLDGIWRGISIVGQPIILLFKNGRIYYVDETWCLNPKDINADSILKDTCQTRDSGFGCRGPLGSGEKYYWEYSLSGDVITVIDKAPQIPLDVPRAMVPNIRYNQKYQWQIEEDTIRTSTKIMNPDFGGDSMTYTRLKQ